MIVGLSLEQPTYLTYSISPTGMRVDMKKLK